MSTQEDYVERHEDGSTAVQALNEIKSAENPDGTYDATVHEIVDDPEELDMSGDEIVVTFDVQVGPHVTDERPDFTLDFPDEFDEFVSWVGDAQSPVGQTVRLERETGGWSLPFRETPPTLEEMKSGRVLYENTVANVFFLSAFIMQALLAVWAGVSESFQNFLFVAIICGYTMTIMVLMATAD